MDSRFAFATAHTHWAVYQERRLLISEGKEVKIKQEILDLLHSMMKMTTVSIIHCSGHQKGRDLVAQVNNQADQVAREVGMQEPIPVMDLQETPAGEWDWTKG
jgi:urease accessory protein UreH